VDNPKFIRQHEERIVKAQKRLSRRKREQKTITVRNGTPTMVNWPSRNWLKAKTALAKRWQRYTDAKEDWQWKRAHTLVHAHDFIAYEDLPIRNMLKNHNLARAIQDASWAGFWVKVENKAAETDSTTRTWKVNPQYTTQRCSRCGHLQLLALSERTYRCQNCGYVTPRDDNSANDILQDALTASGLRVAQPIGMGVPEYTPVETGPLQPETEKPMMVASLVVEAGNKFPTRRRIRSEPTGGTARGEAHDLQSWENVTFIPGDRAERTGRRIKC
jgi:ribosomal protein S27AE